MSTMNAALDAAAAGNGTGIVANLFSGHCSIEGALDLNGGICIPLAVVSTVFWLFVLVSVKYCYNRFLLRGVMGQVNTGRARMPTKVPVIEPVPGHMLETSFDLPVSEATSNQLRAFLDFRGWKGEGSGSVGIEKLRDASAKEAVLYRGELYSERFFEFMDQRFLHNNKAWPQPQPMAPWNGWAGCGLENGWNMNLYVSGSFAYSFEHLICGILSSYYLYFSGPNPSPAIVRLALYWDVGFNCVDLILMTLSIATKTDASILSGPRRHLTGTMGIFKMLLLHHLGAFVMEVIALYTGADPVLSSKILLGLLGVTGMLHLSAVLLTGTPAKRDDRVMLCFFSVVLASMLWFRVLTWPYMAYQGVMEAFAKGGWPATVCCAIGFLIFSAFNYEFVAYYSKLTSRYYRRVFGSKDGKKTQKVA